MTDPINDDEIESFLAGADEILPSSGFASSVIEAVHREISTPPPLAFPWRRAAPGMAALIAALGMAIWRFIVVINNAASNGLPTEQFRQLSAAGTRSEIQWFVITGAVTIVCVLLPLRLMRGRVN